MTETTRETTYLLDEFAILQRLADGLLRIRLFPFGRLVKNGVERIITPELAAKFRLPHFKPPLKIGGHADDAVGGGRIIRLEVGDDGLYGLVEINDRGNTAIEERQYGYHSPEVIWDDGYLEHPETGEPIHGPLIVGDALLHTPHLGEAAALYSVEPLTTDGGDSMTDTVTVPLSFWEKFTARFFDVPEPEPEPVAELQPQQEDYEAKFLEVQGEKETLAAELADLRKANEFASRVTHFAVELKGTPLSEDADIHELLADLDEGTAQAILTKFKALSAQIEHQPDKDVGAPGDPEAPADPKAALNAAIEQHQAEHGGTYNEAFEAIRKGQPDLVSAYLGGNR